MAPSPNTAGVDLVNNQLPEVQQVSEKVVSFRKYKIRKIIKQIAPTAFENLTPGQQEAVSSYDHLQRQAADVERVLAKEVIGKWLQVDESEARICSIASFEIILDELVCERLDANRLQVRAVFELSGHAENNGKTFDFQDYAAFFEFQYLPMPNGFLISSLEIDL